MNQNDYYAGAGPLRRPVLNNDALPVPVNTTPIVLPKQQQPQLNTNTSGSIGTGRGYVSPPSLAVLTDPASDPFVGGHEAPTLSVTAPKPTPNTPVLPNESGGRIINTIFRKQDTPDIKSSIGVQLSNPATNEQQQVTSATSNGFFTAKNLIYIASALILIAYLGE